MPQSWFKASGLEEERLDDEQKLSQAAYDHKWHGHYLDEVKDSVIKGEWFDACINAHKIDRLKVAFEPKGAIVAAHDPSGTGRDAKGYALRHGSIIKRIVVKDDGEIDEGADWATDLAIEDKADWFVWDGDGMGGGLKRQISDNLLGKKMQYHMFRGSLSGSAQDNADEIYLKLDDEKDSDPKTYAETFLNNRSQYIMTMAAQMYATYRCVVRGEYIDPDMMISIDSDGVENLERLRSEVTRLPKKRNGRGLEQIMSKDDMKANDIESPNMADSVMMSLYMPPIKKEWGKLNYQKVSIA
jgi:phage terminase large subunit